MNIMRFNKTKCKGPTPGSGQSPVSAQAGDEVIEGSSEEKDLGVLVNEKLTMSQ